MRPLRDIPAGPGQGREGRVVVIAQDRDRIGRGGKGGGPVEYPAGGVVLLRLGLRGRIRPRRGRAADLLRGGQGLWARQDGRGACEREIRRRGYRPRSFTVIRRRRARQAGGRDNA